MSEADPPRRLTADDVVNYPLKQAVRGYSVQQVDELLDRVADELERAAREIEELRSRLTRSERRLQDASETEATLKRTLVTAQRAAEQSIEEAKSRAAEILDEARRESSALLEQARLDAEELRVEALHAARAEEAEIRRRRQGLEAHIEALRVFERDYRTRLRTHLEQQMTALDDLDARPTQPAVDDDVAMVDQLQAEPGRTEESADEDRQPRPPRAVVHGFDERSEPGSGPAGGAASVHPDT